MASISANIVSKVWDYAHVLRDDGVGYGDYVEQITYLLFLKMAEERVKAGLAAATLPADCSWPTLLDKDGAELELHYRRILEELAKEEGLLGTIFRKSQVKIQDPAKLKRLIFLINEDNWSALDADVKGDIYEGLLARNAEDVKSGAGQYFTPRPLIRAIVEVMRPKPFMSIADPAAGTGGFLLAAHEYIVRNYPTLNRDEKRHLKEEALYGADIVDGVVRLCAMNLYLHGIGGTVSPIEGRDSLASPPTRYFDMVLTNPPFGKKSSVKVIGAGGKVQREALTYAREDFWTSTANKQVNFVQHIKSMLAPGGRAAVVVPDNVLFEAGAGETIRRKLLHNFDVHTLLRLPDGIFYAPGVKANVLFFDQRPPSETPWTKELWIYDLRTNHHFTLKQNAMQDNHLADFVQCYVAANRDDRVPSERFHKFSYEELIGRDKVNLDIFWLVDKSLEESENLPGPEVLAAEITEELEAALEQFAGIEELLIDEEN